MLSVDGLSQFCYHALVVREATLDLSLVEPVDIVQKVRPSVCLFT